MTTASFCALPFMHLATHPNGCVGLCCEMDTMQGQALSQQDLRPSNLEIDSIESVMNSKNFNQYRLQIANGQWPDPCHVCKNKEQQGKISKRIKENARYANTEQKQQQLLDRIDATGKLNHIDFEFIELRLGNTCNLACVTCNPVSSSRWISDAKKISLELPWFENIYTGQHTWQDSPEFFIELAKHSKSIKQIYINGGEPTLISAHFKLLQSFIDNDTAKNISLHYSINCTQMPDELLTLWKKFKHVLVSCSIDEIGDRNDYIRYPSKWADIVYTMNKLYTLKGTNIELSITQTVSAFNVLRLDKFEKEINALWPGLHIYHNYLHTPAFQQAAVIDRDISKLLEYTASLDKIRNTNFARTFPEIVNAKT